MSATYSSARVFSSEAFRDLEDFVQSPRPKGESLEDFERKLREQMNEFSARVLEERLAQFDVDEPEVVIAGERFRRVGRHEKTYHSLSGEVVVERTIYVPSGGGKAVAPLDVRAGLVDGRWTPLLARVMARAVASTTPKEAAELFVEFGGATPSTSSLDRLPKKLSEMWEAGRPNFETELREEEEVPAEAVAVAVSLDGVQVPMKDGERRKKRTQNEKRPQGPAGYREVGCGTISFFDSEGNRVGTVRYARMPERKKVTLKEELREELRSIFNVRPDLTLVLLADGAEDNWDFLDALAAEVGATEYRSAVDIFHVLEHIKKACDAYHGEGAPESKAAFEQARVWLREFDDGVDRVVRSLRYRRDQSRGTKRRAIAAEIRYLEKRRHQQAYCSLLEEQLPIGSGVVEAACKTLASERMKRSGMSWLDEGGQAILTFRSLIQSERFDRAWHRITSFYKVPVEPVGVAA
jgi:hypothetical protein